MDLAPNARVEYNTVGQFRQGWCRPLLCHHCGPTGQVTILLCLSLPMAELGMATISALQSCIEGSKVCESC